MKCVANVTEANCYPHMKTSDATLRIDHQISVCSQSSSSPTNALSCVCWEAVCDIYFLNKWSTV